MHVVEHARRAFAMSEGALLPAELGEKPNTVGECALGGIVEATTAGHTPSTTRSAASCEGNAVIPGWGGPSGGPPQHSFRARRNRACLGSGQRWRRAHGPAASDALRRAASRGRVRLKSLAVPLNTGRYMSTVSSSGVLPPALRCAFG